MGSSPAGGSHYSGALRSFQRTQAEGLVNRWVLLPLVAPSDHPARTGGRSCQQVGSALAVAPSAVEHSDYTACTGRGSSQQIGSVFAGGSL